MTSPLPPPPPNTHPHSGFVPDEARCRSFWKRHGMYPHIQEHSLQVAKVATLMAQRAHDLGLPVAVQATRASALLHDIAKTYSIVHGGNHSQLGAAIVMQLTGNPLLAQGVLHHVYWPFAVDVRAHFTPLAVLYADKRVAHDQLVRMPDRFDDLMERYGRTEAIRERIRQTLEQALDVERAFNILLGVDLDASDFDSGRLE